MGGSVALPGAPVGGEGNSVTMINYNNFLEPAPDVHTYVQGLAFEAAALV
jgi:hypothetical protein